MRSVGGATRARKCAAVAPAARLMPTATSPFHTTPARIAARPAPSARAATAKSRMVCRDASRHRTSPRQSTGEGSDRLLSIVKGNYAGRVWKFQARRPPLPSCQHASPTTITRQPCGRTLAPIWRRRAPKAIRIAVSTLPLRNAVATGSEPFAARRCGWTRSLLSFGGHGTGHGQATCRSIGSPGCPGSDTPVPRPGTVSSPCALSVPVFFEIRGAPSGTRFASVKRDGYRSRRLFGETAP